MLILRGNADAEETTLAKVGLGLAGDSRCTAGLDGIEFSQAFLGIGDGFIPAVLDTSLVDEVIEVTDEDAIDVTRQLGRDQGLLVGISSGANVWAARLLASRGEGNVATILPDRAERYFSTALL